MGVPFTTINDEVFLGVRISSRHLLRNCSFVPKNGLLSDWFPPLEPFPLRAPSVSRKRTRVTDFFPFSTLVICPLFYPSEIAGFIRPRFDSPFLALPPPHGCRALLEVMFAFLSPPFFLMSYSSPGGGLDELPFSTTRFKLKLFSFFFTPLDSTLFSFLVLLFSAVCIPRCHHPLSGQDITQTLCTEAGAYSTT